MIQTATSLRKKRWIVAQPDPDIAARLARELKLPRLVAALLATRGFTAAPAAAAFMAPKFSDLLSPWLLPNMHPAAERIAHAVRSNQKITLYGDYDVDGITGTAMLWHTLKAAGANVDTYIPHRVDEGYGVNTQAIQSIIANGAQLIITVDCGCSAVAPIAAAKEAGIDVVVSDHHEFSKTLPEALAIVHPRFNSEFRIQNSEFTPYPNPDLCGAGVAFKLAWALAQKLCNAEKVTQTYRDLLLEFTALAALGTIADVVPLVGENRIIVQYGLQQLARTQFPGLQSLIRAAGHEDGEKLDCVAVGFRLAPRLNAAGRMDHAREAVELLTTATPERADQIAALLESQNRQRQSTEKKMVEIARKHLNLESPGTPDLPHVIVVADESFHAGVVGIVASRLVDLFHRPAFVLAKNTAEVHGSARSIPGFELHLAIEYVRDLLTSGGGHAMAGGVRMPLPHLEQFSQRLNDFARRHLTDDQLIPTLHVDGQMDLSDCDPRIIAALDPLEPFGRGNPRPRFLIRAATLANPPRRVGSTGSHLQLAITQNRRSARCIAFSMGDLAPQLQPGMELDLVVEPKIDAYNGRTRVDLVLVDAEIRES